MKVKRRNIRKIIKGKKPASRIRQKIPVGTSIGEQIQNLSEVTHMMIDPIESEIKSWRAWMDMSKKSIIEYGVLYDTAKVDGIREQIATSKEYAEMEQERYKQAVSYEIRKRLEQIQTQLYMEILPYKELVSKELASFTGFDYEKAILTLLLEMYNHTDRLLKSENTDVSNIIEAMEREERNRAMLLTVNYPVESKDKEKVLKYYVEFFQKIKAEFNRVTRNETLLANRRTQQIEQGENIVSFLTQVINDIDNDLIEGIKMGMWALISYHHELFPEATVSSPPPSVESESEAIGAPTVPLARSRSV